MWDLLWNDILINPLINGLIILSRVLFGNFGLAIIALTLIVRLATLPLTMRQLHSTRRMTALQPRMAELQKKYKDPKRRQEELMKLYRDEKVNPIGCLGPMLIQMPIWFALYAVLARTVGGTPERTVELAQRLYSWSFIQEAIPVSTGFLWFDLGRRPDMVLIVLVAATTWIQTKLSMTKTTMSSPQAAQTQGMMLWMMPVMFGYFALSVPSGLALYWTVSNLIGAVMNYFVYDWRTRPWTAIFAPVNAKSDGPPGKRPQPAARADRNGAGGDNGRASVALDDGESDGAPRKRVRGGDNKATPAPAAGADERQNDAEGGDKRKERRRGGGQGSRATGSRPVSGRRRNR